MDHIENAWKAYAADLSHMTDYEIKRECDKCLEEINNAESWLEAVASWEKAGKPRRKGK